MPRTQGGRDGRDAGTAGAGQLACDACGLGNLGIVLLVANLGSVLEWFDFAVFGAFAPEFGELFFPPNDPVASMMEAFGVFAGAFFMRPLGGVLFGILGDKVSRRAAVFLSLFMMAFSTFSMGCLPTYASVGVLAPMLLVFVRLLQGLSVGGQLVGTYLISIESSPSHKRGFVSSICLGGATMGTGLGLVVSGLLRATLTTEQLQEWGWRLPFWAGMFVGIAGHFVKKCVEEPPEFRAMLAQRTTLANPTRAALRDNWRGIVSITLTACFWSTGIYLFAVWTPAYQLKQMDPPLESSFSINAGMMFVLFFIMLLCGYLSDKVGLVRMMKAAAAFGALLSIPAFLLIGAGTPLSTILGQLIMAVALGGTGGPLGAWMVRVCPPETRFSSVAVGYNMALAVFGGTAPLAGAALMRAVDSTASPGAYMAVLCIISFCSLTYSQGALLHDDDDRGRFRQFRDDGGDDHGASSDATSATVRANAPTAIGSSQVELEMT